MDTSLFRSPEYRKRTRRQTGLECTICGKQTKGDRLVPINHEEGQFVQELADESQYPEAVSFYPIGPECYKRWAKEFGAKGN